MDRIVIDREILSGKPVIKGTLIPIYLIIEISWQWFNRKRSSQQYPSLEEEDIKAALLYASKYIEDEEIITI
jgi:uncharacterized protein (DUF433 family)